MERDYKFFYELRKIVSLRYGDRIDTKALEKDMQGLMDQYIAAEGISRVTHLINLNDKNQFREEIERLASPAAKADAIRSRMGASISKKYSRDPSYYRKFSERIEKTLNEYKNKRISENEYLEQMYKHYDAYENGEVDDYPDLIKENNNAKAFYGSITDLIKEDEVSYGVEDKNLDDEFAKLSLEIEGAISDLTKVDWHNNRDINNHIAQAIEDLTFEFSKEKGLDLSWDEIDKIINNIKKIAHERF